METVYSRYEIKKSTIKVDGETSAAALNCVGSLEEELNVKTISKSCEGVVKKQRTRGDGTGNLTISLHMPYALYKKLYGMTSEGLLTGIAGYGKNSVHKTFTYTGVVQDEDGVELLVAYPNCVLTSGPSVTITNGAEEVAEIELEVGLMPDEYDYCKYEVMATELPTSITKEKWLNEFSPSMVKSPTA